MTTTIAEMRQRYRPKRIKVLFVAESPPEQSDEKVRFFYNPDEERWDYMYRAMMKAVFPDFEYRQGQKDTWLENFKRRGFYLIDATDRPVNHLSPEERHRELNAAVKGKLAEIKSIVSRGTPIVLIKKNVFSAFNQPLREAGYTVIHESFLPFPSHGHQPRFIEACRDCLRKAESRE